VCSRNHVSHGGPDSPWEKALLRGYMSAHCNVLTHQCIAHCSPAAVGECACPAYAEDECIRHHVKKVKASSTPYRALGPELIPGSHP